MLKCEAFQNVIYIFPLFPSMVVEMPSFFVHFRNITAAWYLQYPPRKAVEMDRQLALQENMEAQQELRESLGDIYRCFVRNDDFSSKGA